MILGLPSNLLFGNAVNYHVIIVELVALLVVPAPEAGRFWSLQPSVWRRLVPSEGTALAPKGWRGLRG